MFINDLKTDNNKATGARELNLMSNNEYRTALYYAAEISKKLTRRMDEDLQDLFEEYGNVCEHIKEIEFLSRRHI